MTDDPLSRLLPEHTHEPSPEDSFLESEPQFRAWVDMSPGQARLVLNELRSWMGTVLVHESATELLRPCWYRHPALVQTLLDTRLAWTNAYRTEADTAPTRALDWTQRHLPHLEDRMSKILRQCTSVLHDPDPLALPGLDEHEVARYVRWWTGERTPHTESPTAGTS